MTVLEEIKKALAAAEQFIVNGVELGYIRMPNPETPDSAHDTLPMIRQAQKALESLQRENEELRKALTPFGRAITYCEQLRKHGSDDSVRAHDFVISDEFRYARTALASTGGEHHGN
ncbi:hypothetical protein ACQZ46_02375 [Agrobacterium salinitolerans]